MTYTLHDRQNLETVLAYVRSLHQTGAKIMSALDDVKAATAAMETEVKVAADAITALAAQHNDPALHEIANRLTAAHDALKVAVDGATASGGEV